MLIIQQSNVLHETNLPQWTDLDDREESRITFMIYLNEDFVGGATQFDDVSIVPKTETALCFIHEQKHEGCPVLEGAKYVLRTDVMYRQIN